MNISSTPYPARHGTSSYIMRPAFDFDVNLFLRNHIQRFAGFTLGSCFSYELHGKSRAFCLANGDCSSTTLLAVCWVEQGITSIQTSPGTGTTASAGIDM